MRRGEVWLVRFDPTIGAEISKTRKAVIVSNETPGVLPSLVHYPHFVVRLAGSYLATAK